ncbi:hypothetical protein E6O75_ATG04720 [Venturia nashicola]|uniref:Uncharacterized protein n=1 Tax=Venturia nashicola TaxID=86259 RepID=A0A4Z1PEK8_9PEZI|nr:hypothetical protein E6O75_ATG04720 [Venturia nashicola]
MWAAISEQNMPRDTTSISKECTQSIMEFCLAALDPRIGVLLGIGPATPCTLACFTAAKLLYTIRQEKLVICGPTLDAMLRQANMWDDQKMKDDEWVIFDEDKFIFWSHESAKAYLEELPMQRFQKNHADPEEQLKQEQPSKEEAALKDYFWSRIKVLFCTNTGAGHAQLSTRKFKPDAFVMDQVNRVTVPEFRILAGSWKGTNPKLIMAGDIRTPNPNPPDLSAHAHNGYSGVFIIDVLRPQVGTPENLYQDSDYHVVVLHDR